jgi:hypothetical protein
MVLGLITINLLSVYFIVNNIVKPDFFFLSENRVLNKFIIIPAYVVPIGLIMYLFYSKNKANYKERFDAFDQLSPKAIRKMNIYFWAYVFGSCVFFFLSIVSSGWLPK